MTWWRKREAGTPRPSRRGVFLDGNVRVEVRGESNFQEALEDICGGRCETGHSLAVTAYLVCEPTNPYDSNAVKVLVDGHLVGYVAREAAQVLAPVLAALEHVGAQATCAGEIVGGWDRGGADKGHFGIWLTMPPPDRIRL